MKRFNVLAVVRLLVALIVMTNVVSPVSLWACACGCNVFDIGTSSMFQTHQGGMVWTEYDYQNQNRNWSGTAPSNADNNPDKQITTNFITLGTQYFFNRSWGVAAELPYWNRDFKTTDANGNIEQFVHSAVGDIRLKGIYTGFSEDMSTGLIFGIKLPSGDNTYQNFDPDTEIGSGSTDLLLGGYHLGAIVTGWKWFVQASGDFPAIHESSYAPGSQIDSSLGAYFDQWQIGGVKIAPVGEVIGSHRWTDAGTYATNPGSGYSRMLLAPGLEFHVGRVIVFTDVAFPVYQFANGDQLIASQLYKLNIAYHF